MVDIGLRVSGNLFFSPFSHGVRVCMIMMCNFNYGTQEVAKIAQWDDEQIEYIQDRVTEQGRQDDIKKGKEPAQVTTFTTFLT